MHNTTFIRLAALLQLFLITCTASAQHWDVVGPADTNWASVKAHQEADLAISPSGHPYIIYNQAGAPYTYKATVRMYNGTTWQNLGADTLTTTTALSPQIEIDYNGTPYIAYRDNADNCIVMKHNGTSWVSLGTVNGPEKASKISLAIDPSGNPLVAYNDNASSSTTVYVRKYNGTSWAALGSAITSAAKVDMDLDAAGTPYIVATDGNNKATVRKFDGTNWINIGSAAFSIPISTPHIRLDNNDIPYIAGQDYVTTGKVIVYKYSSGTWTTFGSLQGSGTAANAIAPGLAFSTANVPYLAYNDNASGSMINVLKKHNGTDWVDETPDLRFGEYSSNFAIAAGPQGSIYTLKGEGFYLKPSFLSVRKYSNGTTAFVGDLGIANTYALYADVAMDRNGVPYMLYMDKLNGDKLSVRRFNGTSWVFVGTQFAAPAPDNLFIRLGIGKSNEPYIGYILHDTLHVRMFNGTAWADLGTYAAKDAYAIGSMVPDTGGKLHIAYQDAAHSYQSTVIRYDNNAWTTVGTPGLANAYYTPAMTIAKNNNIYLMSGISNKPVVYQYHGNVWTVIGTAALATRNITTFDIAVDTAGMPCIAFSDGANPTYSNKVKKFNGTTWLPVGDTNFAVNNGFMKLRFDANNVPYLAFDSKPRLMRFKGVSWADIDMSAYPAIATYEHNFGFDLHPATGQMIYSVDTRAYFMRTQNISNICSEPDSIYITNLGLHKATAIVSPIANATTYEYMLRYQPGPALTSVSDTLRLTGLDRYLPNYLQVRAHCGSDTSGWVTISFMAGDSCISAVDTIKNITDTSVDLAWNKIGNAIYEYAVTATPVSSGTITADTTAHISGLQPHTLYYVYFLTICGADTNAATQHTFTTTALSVADALHPGPLGISPNPVSSNQVSVYVPAAATYGVLYITDITGRPVSRHPLSHSHTMLDISALPKGIYILRYSSNQDQYVQKLIRN